jgi:hypothetical protein
MGKLEGYMSGREDGLKLALDIVRERGVEGLEEEIRFRNITGLHTSLASKDLDKASAKIKNMTVDTVTVMSVAVLRDEFGYGTKRCKRFIDRMNLKAECLMDNMVSWKDFIDDIEEDLGISLRIRWNN